jgi:hypothetical protein
MDYLRRLFEYYLKNNVRQKRSIVLKFNLMLMKAYISGEKTGALLLQTE